MAGANFTGPGGQPPNLSIRRTIHALTTPTVGDMLWAGQFFRSRIRTRTFKGINYLGAPFTPYSTNGPYYFYANAGSAGSVRGRLAPSDRGLLSEVRHARRTASGNRYAKVKGPGVKRTPYGIRFESYAAAKAAHGAATVNLYGMQQHTHMLDTMLVQAGGAQAAPGTDELFLDTSSPLAAFEKVQPCSQLTVGFYGPEAERAKGHNEGTRTLPPHGPEAERAKGHNEGTRTLPPREFFKLSPEDLQLAAQGIAQRMQTRATEYSHG